MFVPGHLHLSRAALTAQDFSFEIDLTYEVVQDPAGGQAMHFDMKGDINGDSFADQFDLPADLACNFASNAERIAHKHGMPKTAVLPVTLHKQYDEMFEDIRARLERHPGDPVKPEHLE